MRPIPLPILLLLFSFLHRPLHSTVVDTLLAFNGISGEELATTTPIPIFNAEEELVVAKAADKSPFGHAKEPVPDVNDTEDISSTSTPFVKVKINFAISNATYENTFSKAMGNVPALNATEDIMVVEALTPEEAKKLAFNNELLFSDPNVVIVEGITLEDKRSPATPQEDRIISEPSRGGQRTSRAHTETLGTLNLEKESEAEQQQRKLTNLPDFPFLVSPPNIWINPQNESFYYPYTLNDNAKGKGEERKPLNIVPYKPLLSSPSHVWLEPNIPSTVPWMEEAQEQEEEDNNDDEEEDSWTETSGWTYPIPHPYHESRPVYVTTHHHHYYYYPQPLWKHQIESEWNEENYPNTQASLPEYHQPITWTEEIQKEESSEQPIRDVNPYHWTEVHPPKTGNHHDITTGKSTTRTTTGITSTATNPPTTTSSTIASTTSDLSTSDSTTTEPSFTDMT